jgi:hypothetical protein
MDFVLVVASLLLAYIICIAMCPIYTHTGEAMGERRFFLQTLFVHYLSCKV